MMRLWEQFFTFRLKVYVSFKPGMKTISVAIEAED